jgi:hypothetical protein
MLALASQSRNEQSRLRIRSISSTSDRSDDRVAAEIAELRPSITYDVSWRAKGRAALAAVFMLAESCAMVRAAIIST